jgi:hypothetical protein
VSAPAAADHYPVALRDRLRRAGALDGTGAAVPLRVRSDDRVTCADPVSWAVLQRHSRITVAVDGTGSVDVQVDGEPPDVLDAVVAGAVPLLRAAGAGDIAPDDEPVLPFDPAWALVDWSRPADQVEATIRAFSWYPSRAHSTDGRRRLTFGGATVVGGRRHVPAGTVVAAASDAITVATADGLVEIVGIRDAIGAVDARALLGCRLGGDPAYRLEDLSRRLADLECLVRYVTDDLGRSEP